jgi:hypothetical protein
LAKKNVGQYISKYGSSGDADMKLETAMDEIQDMSKIYKNSLKQRSI